MDKASEIIKNADLHDLVLYIDYVEILLEITRKRNIEDPSLEEEHLILTTRYKELLNAKK